MIDSQAANQADSTPVRAAPPFPRAPLFGAAALVFATIALAATARLTGYGASHVPVTSADISRDLRFADREDGAVVVTDAAGAPVEVLAPGAHGFIRGVLRGFVRDRRARGIADDPPFRLSRRSDGHLALEDTGTQVRVVLDAFGPTNAQAFGHLLLVKTTAQSQPDINTGVK